MTITEDNPPNGWVLRSIVCTNATGATVGTVTLPSVTVTVGPTDTLSCNFTNERLPQIVAIQKQSVGTTGTFQLVNGTNGLPANLTLDTAIANPASSGTFELNAFNTPTSITETIPPFYLLTSATCVDGSGTAVATTLSGGTLTIDASAVVGGANLTCRFVNTRQSAQVRIDKRWLGATTDDQVTISSTGASNNPGLVSVANTPTETDAGVPATRNAPIH